MSDVVKVNRSSKAVASVTDKIPAASGLNALMVVVKATQDCIKTHQVERTKQTQIRAYSSIETQRIRAAEETLKNYFTQAFDERRTNFEELFRRLDTALEEGDAKAAGLILDTLVQVAKDSPLKDLGDLNQVRAAFDDPDQVWDL